MQHQLSRKDAWNMHLVIDRKFMSKFDTGEQDVEGVERKFLSYLRKHKPYVRRTKGESVAFEEFRRSFGEKGVADQVVFMMLSSYNNEEQIR